MTPFRRALPLPLWPILLAVLAQALGGLAVAADPGADTFIRRIYIKNGDVFDPETPGEDRWIFRLANQLHPNTRPSVIRNLLLFREGDPYRPRLIEESERLLRRERYLYDAQIRIVHRQGNQVDLEVATRDVWTFLPRAGFSRKGGANSSRVEVQDTNFLGLGKDVTLAHETDVDRDETRVRYRDPNLLGSRLHLVADFGDRSDGRRFRFKLERPFFSLDTRWSAGLRVLSEERVDPLYFRGEVTDRFQHRSEQVELFWGRSKGLLDGRALRWTIGATYSSDRFLPAPQEDPPNRLPEDRRLAYPWIGLEWAEDSFEEVSNLDQIGRTEDLELGKRLRARLGWSSRILGADRDRAVFETDYYSGYRLGKGGLLLLEADGGGRWGGQGFENLQLGAGLRYLRRNFGEHLFVVHLRLDAAHNLDGERQLLLGGDSGLRGYPLRFQDGDRRWLVSLEQRFFTDLEILKLARIGAAVFMDAGRAWSRGGLRDGNEGLLTDVGIGLRVAPTRSGRGTVLHLDLALPLAGDGSFEGLQWLVTTRERF